MHDEEENIIHKNLDKIHHMKNRREFIKKSALAGIALSGFAVQNSNLYAQDEDSGKNKQKRDPSIIIKSSTYQNIRFVTSENPGELTLKAISIFNRVLTERTGIDFYQYASNPLIVKLIIVPQSMPSEAFRIENPEKDTICITANDGNGILYGVGKLLHSSTISEKSFTPGAWQGLSIPEKPVRGIYFASHFHNYYHEAPVEKVTNYIEELALWGYNALEVWFDMHGFYGISDPEAVAMLDRLALLLRIGKSVGMKISIGILANEGYNSSPKKLRAKPTGRSHYGVEICPSQPGGIELILQQVNDELDAFSKRGVTLDFLSLCPYDQGGCGCDQCAPWGCNGYLRMSEEITRLARKKVPGTKIILMTWLFDYGKDQGEWVGLAKAFNQEKPWVDYIQADSHSAFPPYLMSNPVPGNLPLLNFPEISMWGSWPWGAYGANPLPGRFQRLWDTVKDKVAGGFPYSEGIFEDMNKIIYSQFYWEGHKPAIETIREYVSFEFSADHADAIIEAIEIIEKNHGQSSYKWAMVPGSPKKIEMSPEDHGAKKAYELMKAVDSKLPHRTKKAWRWRILLLRSMFDYELRLSEGIPNEKIEVGFQELYTLYNAEKGTVQIRPPINYGERYPVNKESVPDLVTPH